MKSSTNSLHTLSRMINQKVYELQASLLRLPSAVPLLDPSTMTGRTHKFWLVNAKLPSPTNGSEMKFKSLSPPGAYDMDAVPSHRIHARNMRGSDGSEPKANAQNTRLPCTGYTVLMFGFWVREIKPIRLGRRSRN